MKQSKLLAILSVVLLSTNTLWAAAQTNERRFTAIGKGGAISCGHPLAAAAAIKILQEGGNAVDAAVCAGFMLGVVDFSNSGIGGDGFALIRLSSGRIVAFDGSARRPRLQQKTVSDNDIGLPTMPEMLLKLLRLYGNKSPQEVLIPSVTTCVNGFKISAYLEKTIEKKLLTLKDSASIDFLAPGGYPLRAGQIIKQPVLARTLLQLARDGGRSFYRGNDAMQLLADMQRRGSEYQFEDMALFSSKPVKPVKFSYQNYNIYGTPPPSSSVATIKLAIDLLNSAKKLFPRTGKELVDLARIGQKVINAKYAGIAACMNNPAAFADLADATPIDQNTSSPTIDDTNTTHLCVWDKTGMIVSMTLTLGNHFGTGEFSPGGFFYNNELRNYKNVVASYPADYPASAGPVSSKSPLLITRKGQPWLAIGGAGSNRIIFNTALTLARTIAGYELTDSITAPRFYLDYRNRMSIEWQKRPDLTSEIRALLPDTEIKAGCDDFFGLVSAIQASGSYLISAGDQRRDGCCESEP